MPSEWWIVDDEGHRCAHTYDFEVIPGEIARLVARRLVLRLAAEAEQRLADEYESRGEFYGTNEHRYRWGKEEKRTYRTIKRTVTPWVETEVMPVPPATEVEEWRAFMLDSFYPSDVKALLTA
jgi:hypothetical protein